MCDELHVRLLAAAALLTDASPPIRGAFARTRLFAQTVTAVVVPQPTGPDGLALWNAIAPDVQSVLASTKVLCDDLETLGSLGPNADAELLTILDFLRADARRFSRRVADGSLEDPWRLTADFDALLRGARNGVTGLLSLFVRTTHGRHAPQVAEFLAADSHRTSETVRHLRHLSDLLGELQRNPQQVSQTTDTIEQALADFVSAGALHTMPVEMRRDFIAFRLGLLSVDDPGRLGPAIEGILRFVEVLTHEVAKGQKW